jgi:hypothetical protein
MRKREARMKRPLRNLAIVIGIAGIGGIWLAIRWDYIRIRPANRAVEQDAVYEAVLRSVEPDGRVRQSKFDNRTLGEWGNTTPSQCAAFFEHDLQGSAKTARSAKTKLPNGSVYDWLYVVAYGFPYDALDDSVRPETIRDFAERYCAPGLLPQTFRTNVPKEFVDSLKFEALEKEEEKATGRLVSIPELDCLSGLSFVGFDARFREAIVGWSRCGAGSFFVLKKSLGRWKVVGTLRN